ncbi:MAG TPA: filamentous hemagglutinin N-terminal domain-containing protein, partial [Ideonella sp.]|nr:filamentous hemagglutinin N-terminal domain-containing protein [Ideonella sp.]
MLLLLASSGAGALPAGGQVVGGVATIQTPAAGQQLVTQGTQRAIIDWTSFSIGSGETVRFAQPSSTSLVLNRVTGYDPSRILGQLQANGRVFLLNPYGVVFGAGARVDVGALVASTLNLSNADFLAGLYRLNSNDGVSAAQRGAVVNEGAISAPGGTVALVGPQVSNRGTIDAPLGRVGLGAADQVLVDVDGGGLVLFQVAGAQATNKLEQLGQIRADGGSVELQAAARAALTDTVLNLDGVVQARGLGTRQGRVVIDGGDAGVTRVAGTVDVSGRAAGEQGGRAEVLGHDVLVDSTARIDARGDAGGGAVRIGGDWQGQGELRHADQTIVAAGASIDASALARGDGGSVVVWSDTSTQYYGSIAARGGALGGDGGAVETSGKAFLTLAGSVDASAPFGANGQWLLDPFNVTIGNAATDTGVKVDATTFTANTNNTNIKASDLES